MHFRNQFPIQVAIRDKGLLNNLKELGNPLICLSLDVEQGNSAKIT
jgi:hypothetical protein